MKPSTPFSLSTLLLLAAIMATLAAFGGFEAQASKPLSASSSSPLKTTHTSTPTTTTTTSGRIGRRLKADDLSAAASSLTNSGTPSLNGDAADDDGGDDEVSSLSSKERTRKLLGIVDTTKESALEPRGLESNIANAKIKLSTNDMATAAGHHHGKSAGKYYMYAEVPKKHSYKMGFKRGNHKHLIERKESAHKSHVSSYFKWHDKKGKGSHKFEFKHKGKGKKGHYY